MQGRMEKFFTNDELFRWSALLSIVFYIIAIAGYVKEEIYYDGVNYFFVIIIMICLLGTFLKHEKNAMKGLIGALLAYNVTLEINTVSGLLFGTIGANGNEQGTINWYIMVTTLVHCVMLILVLILFFNHFNLAKTHSANAKGILLNQVLIFSIMVCVIVDVAAEFIIEGFSYISLCIGLATILNYDLVVCIETKIDSYKVTRDQFESEGEWDEEKKAELKKKTFGD